MIKRLRAMWTRYDDDTLLSEAADLLASLSAQLIEARAALRFYAEPGKVVEGAAWSDGYPGGIVFQDGRYTMRDTGQRAIRVLGDTTRDGKG